MGEEKSDTKKTVLEVSALVEPLMQFVDLMRTQIGMEKLVDIENGMWSDVSHLEAFPFPETLNKADEIRRNAEVFSAIVKLVKTRCYQTQKALEGPSFATGSEILKAMGYAE